MKFIFGANSDIGNSRKLQEDYVMVKEYPKGNIQEGDSDILAVVADGTGTSDDRLQPAVLAVSTIMDSIDYIKNESDLFNKNPLFFLKKAMLEANNILGTLKIANEEFYSGYAASISLLYMTSEGRIYYAHAGNTRIYLLRQGNLIQMTEDHTVAQQKIDNGEEINYYLSSDRLKMTNGIGLVADPLIYCNEGNIKTNDIIIMTSDGIHYAIQPEYITNIILESEDPISAATNLVNASKDVVQYPDNASAIIIAERK